MPQANIFVIQKYFLFNDDNCILFNDKNYNTLIDIINKEFGGPSLGIEVEYIMVWNGNVSTNIEDWWHSLPGFVSGLPNPKRSVE